jgi:hypothetical protein
LAATFKKIHLISEGERKQSNCELIALMMEAARTSETSVNFYQTTRRYNPEDSHLHTNRRENLKSYKVTANNVEIPYDLILETGRVQ